MRCVLFLLVLALLLGIGCQAPQPFPGAPAQPSSSSPAVVAAQPTPLPTSTIASTATRTPMPTPTPQPSATPTLVPSPTPTPVPTWPRGAPELVRGNTSQPFIAITLDAGAGSEHTPAILQLLRERDLRATVFLTGKWAEQNPALVREIVADGHELANHSYDHPDFTTLSSAQMIEQLTRTEEIIRRATGKSSKPLFRYPYGARNASTNAVVTGQGYRSIFWTLDSADWREETTPAMEEKRVLTYAGNGDIIVFHLNAAPTAKSLGAIVDQLRASGFTLGKVSELPL